MACTATLLSVIGYVVFLNATTPIQIKVVDYDVYRTEALKMNREESASFFQIGVAILGALWATMIVSKDNRLRGKDWPEIGMFIVTTVFLMMFLYFNWHWGRLLAQLYWDMGPLLSTRNQFADILNSRYLQTQHNVMQLCFYVGLILSAVSIFSCCILRREP